MPDYSKYIYNRRIPNPEPGFFRGEGEMLRWLNNPYTTERINLLKSPELYKANPATTAVNLPITNISKDLSNLEVGAFRRKLKNELTPISTYKNGGTMKLKRYKKMDLGGDFDPRLKYGKYYNQVGSPDESLGLLDTSLPNKVNSPFDVGTTNPNTSSSGFNFGSALGSAVPYISNAANAMRKLPKPPRPVKEGFINTPNISFDADRASLLTGLRTATKGTNSRISNPAVSQALKADVFGRYVSGSNELAQQERNLNSNIGLRTSAINAGITARNVERENEYRGEKTGRKIAQQNLNLENLADIGTKAQLQKRDQSMFDLEDRKLDILLKKYQDTGVLDRQLMDELMKEKAVLSGEGRYGGRFSRLSNKGVEEGARRITANRDEYSRSLLKRKRRK